MKLNKFFLSFICLILTIFFTSCWYWNFDTVECGETLNDADNITYKTFCKNNQLWMMEDLRTGKNTNYKSFFDNSVCLIEGINKKDTLGNVYYSFNETLLCRTQFQEQNFQGICPLGWRIPSIADFNNLFNSFENVDSFISTFNPSYAGYHANDGRIINKGMGAPYISTSKKDNITLAYFIYKGDKSFKENNGYSNTLICVRCLKDIK